MSDLLDFGSLVEFVGGENFKIRTKSHMVKGEININAEKIESDEVGCWYDLSFFEKIFDIKMIIKELKVGFGNDVACIIKGENDFIKFKWLIAPRVTENE